MEDRKEKDRLLRAEITDRIVIGREEGDIQIPYDSAISHRHCEITKEGKRYFIRDLASANGTFLGGKKITGKAAISEGDEMKIGRHSYVVRMETK